VHPESFELRASAEWLIESHKVQRLRPIARRQQRGAELHRVGSRQWMDADEPFGAAPHTLHMADGRPFSEQFQRIKPDSRQNIRKVGSRTAQAAECRQQLDTRQHPDHDVAIVCEETTHVLGGWFVDNQRNQGRRIPELHRRGSRRISSNMSTADAVPAGRAMG